MQLSGLHALGAVLLLICSAVVAADAARIAKLPEKFDDASKFCKNLDKATIPYYTTCETYDAAVVSDFQVV